MISLFFTIWRTIFQLPSIYVANLLFTFRTCPPSTGIGLFIFRYQNIYSSKIIRLLSVFLPSHYSLQLISCFASEPLVVDFLFLPSVELSLLQTFSADRLKSKLLLNCPEVSFVDLVFVPPGFCKVTTDLHWYELLSPNSFGWFQISF